MKLDASRLVAIRLPPVSPAAVPLVLVFSARVSTSVGMTNLSDSLPRLAAAARDASNSKAAAFWADTSVGSDRARITFMKLKLRTSLSVRPTSASRICSVSGRCTLALT